MVAFPHPDILRIQHPNSFDPFPALFPNQNQLYLNALQRGYYGLPVGFPGAPTNQLPLDPKFFCLPPAEFLRNQSLKPGMFYVGANALGGPFDISNVSLAQTFPPFFPGQLINPPHFPGWTKEGLEKLYRPMDGLKPGYRENESSETVYRSKEGTDAVYRSKDTSESSDYHPPQYMSSKWTDSKEFTKLNADDSNHGLETEPISGDESPHIVSSTNIDEEDEECMMCNHPDSLERKMPEI
jgi:hypothetical protein